MTPWQVGDIIFVSRAQCEEVSISISCWKGGRARITRVCCPGDNYYDDYNYMIRFVNPSGEPWEQDNDWSGIEWGILRVDGPDPLVPPFVEEFDEPAGPKVS